MRINDLLDEEDLEEITAVPNERYPMAAISERNLDAIDVNQLKKVKETPQYSIYEEDESEIFLAVDGKAVGLMGLFGDAQGWQVANVYLKPEYRNLRLGRALYDYVLKDRRETFKSGAAMTPFSQRLWVSLFNDPSLDVHAVWPEGNVKQPGETAMRRVEVHVGDDRLEADGVDIWKGKGALVARLK